MLTISQFLVYIFLFCAFYFEVFILVTYFENRKDIKMASKKLGKEPKYYPSVCIIVPCWNEEETVVKTIDSLLNMDYPKEKLEVVLIDDGSTDNTWSIIQQFSNNPIIKVFSKENGGKYTALNFGLTKSKSELVGCLDADSFVAPDALKNIVLSFEENSEIMAVTPSAKIYEPKSLMQIIQSVEYILAIFTRKVLAYINAIYITPGPFSIFKREVFQKIGGYREGHKTEDMELAMRMQTNHMKIANAHNAFVYTTGPKTFKKLYTQRVRWAYGFIKNISDYRQVIFRKKYGNLGLFVLPMASFAVVGTVYMAIIGLIDSISQITNQIIKIRTIGFHLPHIAFSLDWFSINTNVPFIFGVAVFMGTIFILFLSKSLAQIKYKRFNIDLVYFIAVYSFITPIWLAKALYNTLMSVKTTWR